jgi:hypothetical protein
VSEKIAIVLSHPWEENTVGDRLELDKDEAQRLVGAGYAQYATKNDAKSAGAPESQARTTKKA